MALGDREPTRHRPAPIPVENDRDAADRLERLRRSLLSLAADSRKKFHSVSRAKRGEKPAPRKASLAMPFKRACDSFARPLTKRSIFRGLDFEDLFFFPLQEVVDLVRVVVGQLLNALLGPVLLVASHLALVDELLEVVHDVAADVPDRDAAVLGHLPGDLDELLSPLLGQLRDREADDLAVVRRGQAEVGLLDRSLDP